MGFQGNTFVRNQNFVRDRHLGAPDNTIAAEKVDNEFDNVGDGLSAVKGGLATLQTAFDQGQGDAYTKSAADQRFVKAASALDDIGALAKAGGATTGPITLGGKPGAAKGTVASGTVTFDYTDGNVQTVTVAGPLTFAFANLPAAGGALQVNFAIQSGSITFPAGIWWELGGGEKDTDVSKLGITFKTGRPYRLIVENVAGYLAGILQ